MRIRGRLAVGSILAATSVATAAQPPDIRTDPEAIVRLCVPPELTNRSLDELAPERRRAVMSCAQGEAARQLNVQTPIRLDEFTVLRSVTADGPELTYWNHVDVDAGQVTAAQRETLSQSARANVCGQPPMRSTISHGGSYRYVWIDRAGVEIARAAIASC